MARAKQVQGTVPKLRFPGFEGERWGTKPLREVCLRITNGKANAEDHEEDGIYPLFDRSESVKKSKTYIFDGEVVILPGEGMRFQPRHYKGKFNLHQRAYALMEFQQDAKFVFHALDSMKDEIARQAVSSTVLSLRLPIIEGFEIALPSPVEQKKIADCLSSLDACIGAETRKLDVLKVHKQGLMQRLFPAEGQRLPRLRFSGFTGKWDLSPLASHIETVTPPKKLQTSQYMDRGNYPVIDQSQEPIAGWTDDTESLVAGPFPLIVFGDHTCTLKLARTSFAQGADGIKIFNATEGVSTGYLYQYLLARPLTMWDYRRHFSILKERTVHFPVDQSEQAHIFEFLSGVDALIVTQSRKIAALQQHKKGLVQGLFPAVDSNTA